MSRLGPGHRAFLVLGAAAVGMLALPVAANAVIIDYTTPCAPQIFNVPAGVTSLTVEAFGAQGGSGGNMGGSGNFGGYAKATLTVIPGSSLQINVGGQGGAGFVGTGGCNGGGSSFAGQGGGGGGGASDVRLGGVTLADRVIVASGGGGGGVGSCAPGGFGGVGGSLTGGAGTDGGNPPECIGGTGGGGGTQAAGGAAGSGGAAGTAGVLGVGGTGGMLGGGGGGGGYFGGGGGGSFTSQGAGGGGGSGFAPVGGMLGSGLRGGDGLVRLTYGVTAVTVRTLTASARTGGVYVRWRTGTEADVLGFQVYRSRGHSWHRLTRSLIAARGPVSGASYRYVDRTARRGVSYHYRIKALNRDGTSSWSGPVRVQ